MKFQDLSPSSRTSAREALKELIARQEPNRAIDFKYLGKVVAQAYIAMERFDGAPDDEKVKIGDSQLVK